MTVCRKWNESGFRPPLCTYRLNWARRTSWGWWDDWDDTVLQTQDSKFEPWRSEAEHATSRSRMLPTILTFTRGWGRNIFCFFQTAETGNRAPNSGVKGSGANHYPRAPARQFAVLVSLPMQVLLAEILNKQLQRSRTSVLTRKTSVRICQGWRHFCSLGKSLNETSEGRFSSDKLTII